MSDIPEDEAVPHPADPAQPLVDFVGGFNDPQAQEVFRDAAVRVQDYMVRRNIADENAAAANRMADNLGRFKDGLVEMVSTDPAAVNLGLDLVPDVIHGLVGTHPYMPDDQREGAATGMVSDIQREIGRAAVMSLADRDEAAARRLLGGDRVSGLFDDRDQLALSGYIGAQATARSIDADAVAQQRAVDQAKTADFQAIGYVSSLLDDNGSLQFPPGWAQQVTADPTVSPGATAAMLNMYTRLQQDGDAETSDPFVMADMISAAANGTGSVPAALGQAGRGLRAVDAVGMAQMAMSPDTTTAGVLNDLAQEGRTSLASTENGLAGQQAFSRFMNWLVPAVRNGLVSLDPGDKNYAGLHLPQFAPSANDLVQATVQAPVEGRKPLDAIFGANRVGRNTYERQPVHTFAVRG